MFTDVQVINLGLSKIASSRISRIDPPQTSLERFVAEGYAHWRRSELAKHKWVFAREDEYALALIQSPTSDEPLSRVDGRNFKYELPVECLRPIRTRKTEWKQRGRAVYSAYENLKIDFIQDVEENQFDPMFVEVLCARVALECVEYVTQSNTKKADVNSLYRQSVEEAKGLNAFTVGPEDVSGSDDDYPFLTARFAPDG